MRTQLLNQTSFTFLELSEEAKDKARSAYIATIADDEWWLDTVGELEDTILPLVGFECKISFRLSYSQSDNAKLTGEYSYKSGGLRRLKKDWPHMPLIQHFEDLQELQRKNFYGVFAQLNKSHWIRYDVENQSRDDVCDEDGFKDVFRWLEQSIYQILRDEYEYLCSDLVVDEAILSHGFEYLADGTPH